MSEHERMRASLAALAAGALTPDEAATVRAHLAACSECARQSEGWQRLAGALERSPQTQPTPARLARITALAVAHRQEVLAERQRRWLLSGLVAFGAALFVALLPLAATLVGWLAGLLNVTGTVALLVGVTTWWALGALIGLGLWPLVAEWKQRWEEKTV
jgi:anti-sigma factor RsiW